MSIRYFRFQNNSDIITRNLCSAEEGEVFTIESSENNRQNSSSRSRLLEASRTLFYDQGYAATTLAQISEKSGVNNGLITYYFGTKSRLAGEIYTKCLMDLRSEISRHLFLHTKQYSMALGIAVENRVLLAQKFENPNFLRFSNEYQKDSVHFIQTNERRERYYSLQKELINPDISDIDLQLYSVCGIAVVRCIAEAYEKNYLQCDIEYLKDYVIRTLFTMLHLSPDETEKLVEESKIWEKEIHFKVGPSFMISAEE